MTSVIAQHVPDVSTFSGLCDFMALGNVCEIGVFLQRRFYTENDLDPMDLEECHSARFRYRQFQLWFSSKYTILIDGEHVTPFAVFRRSLVEFMAAVSFYKYRMEEEVPVVPNLTSETLLQAFLEFFKSEYPELLVTFKQLTKKNHSFFYWTGPRFEVKLRNGEGTVEQFDFKDFQLYAGNEVQHTGAASSGKRKLTDDGSECTFIAEWEPLTNFVQIRWDSFRGWPE